MRYWIKDEIDSPQGFPLLKLFKILMESLSAGLILIWLYRSQGYGDQVSAWDEMLDNEERLKINRDDLFNIFSGEKEWFYDLDVRLEAENMHVRFGVHDSSSLFVEGDESFLQSVVKNFENVET